MGIEAAPLTLDPRFASDAYSSKITHLLYDGLFTTNERLEIVPDLVEEYRFTPPVTYRFRLRAGVHFSDGRELTAKDVKWTIESLPADSPFRSAFEPVSSIRVIDPRNLEIILKAPFAPFLSALTIGILPEGGGPSTSSGQGTDGQPAPGTGPFSLKEFVPAERVVLERTDRSAPIQKLIFRVVPDDNLRVLELMNGRIDLLQNNVPPTVVRYLQKNPALVVERTEGINYSYLGLNLREPPLSRLEVRQAILHALDIPAIIEYRLGGYAHPATGLIAPIHWAYEGDVTQTPYDPEKARTLLDQAGYPDPDGAGPAPRFTLTYKTSTKKDRIGLARLIARYLKEVGIETKILPYEWGTFFHDVNSGNFQLFSLTWVGITEPDIFYSVFHSSQVPPQGANRGGYQNTAVDRLVEEGRKVADRGQRQQIYSLVQKLLAQDLPYLSLWYEDNVAVFRREVKGVRLRPDASFDWATEVTKE